MEAIRIVAGDGQHTDPGLGSKRHQRDGTDLVCMFREQEIELRIPRPPAARPPLFDKGGKRLQGVAAALHAAHKTGVGRLHDSGWFVEQHHH